LDHILYDIFEKAVYNFRNFFPCTDYICMWESYNGDQVPIPYAPNSSGAL